MANRIGGSVPLVVDNYGVNPMGVPLLLSTEQLRQPEERRRAQEPAEPSSTAKWASGIRRHSVSGAGPLMRRVAAASPQNRQLQLPLVWNLRSEAVGSGSAARTTSVDGTDPTRPPHDPIGGWVNSWDYCSPLLPSHSARLSASIYSVKSRR